MRGRPRHPAAPSLCTARERSAAAVEPDPRVSDRTSRRGACAPSTSARGRLATADQSARPFPTIYQLPALSPFPSPPLSLPFPRNIPLSLSPWPRVIRGRRAARVAVRGAPAPRRRVPRDGCLAPSRRAAASQTHSSCRLCVAARRPPPSHHTRVDTVSPCVAGACTRVHGAVVCAVARRAAVLACARGTDLRLLRGRDKRGSSLSPRGETLASIGLPRAGAAAAPRSVPTAQ